ncbi:GLPGLI family protein [Flavobacterium jejuense]|uniref:GLPGLI family protein n=1 Tax=Flavobacterium jejuense TaxID=1544455 RepID=A0ABX0ITA5_9FLAO|nr:GLPGLI family protein [Flavobacterium jejuense]NHN26350.1 GLPGLI family protein [Flavobacterium jejuense]
MKKEILLFVVLCTSFVYSQNNVAKYNVLFKVENQKKESPFFDKISEASKNLEFELIFNDSISYFSTSKKMILDDNSFEKVASKIISKGEYLYKKKESLFLVINDHLYYEKKANELNWELTSEKKIIQNLTCYKATKVKKVVNQKGTFNHQITAWFCPEIPFSYGPNEYNGLPGLIVELIEMPANHFVLKSLTFKKEDAEIIELNKLNKIDEKKYYDVIKSNLPQR